MYQKQKKKVKKSRSILIIVLDLLSSNLISKTEAKKLLSKRKSTAFNGWVTNSTYNTNIHYENN
jgi:hypothetical protein